MEKKHRCYDEAIRVFVPNKIPSSQEGQIIWCIDISIGGIFFHHFLGYWFLCIGANDLINHFVISCPNHENNWNILMSVERLFRSFVGHLQCKFFGNI